MISKSKLGQSIMRTIDGGKAKDTSKLGFGFDDAFDQAEKNGAVGEQIESPIKAKPKKIKSPKQKTRGGMIGVVALLLSVSAIGIAGYSIVSQKLGQATAMKNADSMNSAIGTLNTKTDELTAELAGTQKDVQFNADRLEKINGLRLDVKSIQTVVNVVQDEMNGVMTSINSQGVAISTNQKQIEKLNDKIKQLKARAASAPKKVVQRSPTKTKNTDPSIIEGAYVASVDLWGSQSYVMLREENGNWVPLTTGDYYKGWRLEGATGSEAVFQKNSKTKRLRIKE